MQQSQQYPPAEEVDQEEWNRCVVAGFEYAGPVDQKHWDELTEILEREDDSHRIIEENHDYDK